MERTVTTMARASIDDLHAGFGVDDANDADLGPGERALRRSFFANTFWDWSRIVGFAVEVGRWQTDYVGQGRAQAWRGEVVGITRF